MTALTVTAARIALLFPELAEVFDGVAAETITAGKLLYFNTSGKLALADANAGSKAERVVGLALTGGGAGQAISVLKRGHVGGVTVSSLAYGADVFLSDTAGGLDDTPSTTNSVAVGRVVPLSDNTPTKVLYFDADIGWMRHSIASNIFVSAEQTGTGAPQNVAHGLGTIPTAVLVAPTDLTPATVGSYSVVEGTHTTTNVVLTVTSGKKFKVVAFA